MFRLFDWECVVCERIGEHVVTFPGGEDPPLYSDFECKYCGEITKQHRLPPLFGEYIGDHIFNYRVHGGHFDTMGDRQLPKLPDIDGAKEHDQKVAEYAKSLPEMPVAQMHKEISNHFAGTGPSMADYADHVRRPEYKEVRAEQKRIKAENREKKQRAAAIFRGENINMRSDRCKGDPNIME